MEKTAPFANLTDLCHLKNAELGTHLPECKERVVLLRDDVKVGGGHRTVPTEQGASASQMAAAKFLDTIRKLPGMAGDAISAYTQVKMTEARRLLRMPKEECPPFLIRILPR